MTFPVRARVTALAGHAFIPGLGASTAGYSTQYRGYTIEEISGGYAIYDPERNYINVDIIPTVPAAKRIIDDTIRYHQMASEEQTEASVQYRAYTIQFVPKSRTYYIADSSGNEIGSGFISVTAAKKAIDKHLLSMAPAVGPDEVSTPAPESTNDFIGPLPPATEEQQDSSGGAFDWLTNLLPSSDNQPPAGAPQQHQPGVVTPQPSHTAATPKTNWMPFAIAGGAGLVLLMIMKK